MKFISASMNRFIIVLWLVLPLSMHATQVAHNYRCDGARFNAYAKFIFSNTHFSVDAQMAVLEGIQRTLLDSSVNAAAAQAWVAQAQAFITPPVHHASARVQLASCEDLYKKIFYRQVLEHYFIAVCEVVDFTIEHEEAVFCMNSVSLAHNQSFDAAVRKYFGLGQKGVPQSACMYFLANTKALIALFCNEARLLLEALFDDMDREAGTDISLGDIIDRLATAVGSYLPNFYGFTAVAAGVTSFTTASWPEPVPYNELDCAMGDVYVQCSFLKK